MEIDQILPKMKEDYDIWSTLPLDLLIRISNCLQTRTDKNRLRSVCSPWLSVPKPPPSWRPRRIYVADANYHFPYVGDDPLIFLLERRIYYLQPSSDATQGGTFVTVEERGRGMVRAYHPLSGDKHSSFPRVLDLLNLRVFELSKFYHLNIIGDESTELVNVASSVNDAASDLCGVSLMWIYDERLWYLSVEDGQDSVIECVDWDEYISDVIYHRGKFYAVDELSNVLIFHSVGKFEVVESLAAPNCRGTNLGNYFVECCGALYLLVDAEPPYTDLDEDNLDEDGEEEEEDDDDYFIMPFRLDDSAMKWELSKLPANCSFFVGQCTSFSFALGSFPELDCLYTSMGDGQLYSGQGFIYKYHSESETLYRLSASSCDANSKFRWPP